MSGAQDIIAEYVAVRPTYEAMALRFRDLLIDLLKEKGLDVIQVEARAKSVDSLKGKLRKKGEKYENGLGDITDLCGLRVITYYLEDVDLVEALIDREFEVDRANSVDKSIQLQ